MRLTLEKEEIKDAIWAYLMAKHNLHAIETTFTMDLQDIDDLVFGAEVEVIAYDEAKALNDELEAENGAKN